MLESDIYFRISDSTGSVTPAVIHQLIVIFVI